jgi:WD40 repeat protein
VNGRHGLTAAPARRASVAAGAVAVLWLAAAAAAGEPLSAVAPARAVDFESDVLPIFRRSCLACHNAARAEGDLVLETPARILAGGASGPAVLPGKGEESLLFRVAAHSDDPVMPPDGNDRAAPRLSAPQLGIVRAWIDAGAKGEVRGTRPLVWQPPAADRRPVHAVAVSPDGGLVAAGRADGIFVHETFGKRVVGPLVDPDLPLGGLGRSGGSHVSTVESLAFSPDGSRLASGDFRTLRIWKRGEPQPSWRRAPAAEGGPPVSAAAVLSGTLTACGLEDGRVVVVASAAAEPLVLAGHVARVTALAAVPGDAPRLVTAAADGTIRLWDLAAGREIGRIGGSDAGSTVRSLALIAAGGRIAAAAADGGVRVWPLPAGPPAATPVAPAVLVPPGAGVAVVAAVDAAGTRLAAGCADGTVRLLDVQGDAPSGKELSRADAGGVVTSLAAAAAAGRLVAGTAAGRATVFAVTPEGTLAVVSKTHADASPAPAVEPLELARQRAGLVVAAAREDLDAAIKERDGERAASYAAIIEIAKTDVEQVKKESAAAAPTAALAAAEEGARKARAAVDTAAEAEKAKAEAAAKAADDAVVKARGAVETAETERRRAAEAHAAAKVTVGRVAESVARATAAAALAERAHDEAKDREKAAADELALVTRSATAAGERLDRLATQTVGGDGGAASALPPAALAGIEAAARGVDDAEMAAMRSVMQAQTLLQQSEDARKMAEQTAGEADKGAAAARAAAEQAAKEVEEARRKLAAAADDEAKKLRGAELEVAEKKAATARDDVAAAEQRLARLTAAREQAAAAALQAVPQAESLKNDAERRLAEARQRLETVTAETRKGTGEGQGPLVDGRLEAWRRERAASLLEKSRRPIVAVAIVPDGGEFILADEAGVVRRAAAADGRPLGAVPAGPAIAVAFAADGGLLVAGPQGVARWPWDPGWTLERRIGNPTDAGTFAGAVTAVAFSPDGVVLATGGGTPSRSGEIALWRAATGERLGAIPDAHSDAVLAIDFSPAGDLLASGSADRSVRVFDVAKGGLAASFEGHQQHVLGVAWRADGRLLASAAADGVVKTWDLRRGELRKSHPAIAGEATGVRYLAAGDTLVASAAEGRLHARTSDGGNAQSFSGSGTCLHALGGSRMGRVIAAGGEDGTVQVWDAAGKPLAVLAP